MSDRRYSSKYRDRSPDSDRRYDRRRSDTPEGQDARGLTPEPSDRRRERSSPPPNNGNKRRRDSDWESVEPKRRKSRDRSRDRKRDRRSRSPPYRDRSPPYRDRSPPSNRSPAYRGRTPSPPSRDRSPNRISSERKLSRSHRSRSRSPRSPKRSDRSRKREVALQDTSLFAEMRKKKHLRDKLEARTKSNKREDFEETVLDGKKSSLDKGNISCFTVISIFSRDSNLTTCNVHQ